MKTIYKYQLEVKRAQTVTMPMHAIDRLLADQHGVICLWSEVDTAQPMHDRLFECYGTGQEIPQDMGISRKYIGSVLDECRMVWHFYQRLN